MHQYISRILFTFVGLLFSSLRADLLQPYNLADKFYPYSDSDFFKNGRQLVAILDKNNVRSIIEIGCWFGESTIFMASHLQRNGKVYAIDSWIGYPRETYKITRYVYERFLSNVIHAGLTDRIVPIRMTSLTANRIFAQKYSRAVDMVYIDGDHAYKAVYSDIKAWRPYVKPGGILCGNLYAITETEMQEIRNAVQDYSDDYKVTAVFDEYFWRIAL